MEDLTHEEGPLPPEVGKLGESPEQLERRRIASLPVDRAPVPVKPLLPDARERSVMRQELRVLVSELGRDVREELHQVGAAIREQGAAMKTLDVPLEQVADSHERATHSFETLRGENAEIALRLYQVETLLEKIAKKLGVL